MWKLLLVVVVNFVLYNFDRSPRQHEGTNIGLFRGMKWDFFSRYEDDWMVSKVSSVSQVMFKSKLRIPTFLYSPQNFNPNDPFGNIPIEDF